MVTHAACEIGTIGTTANTYSDIGALVTMAQGGPWGVYALGGELVTGIGVAAEMYGGHIRVDPDESDDWNPVPTPLELPTSRRPSQLGTATAIADGSPINMWPIDFSVRGGSSFNFQGAEAIANNAAAVGIAALFYSDSGVPQMRPFQKVRRISGNVDATAETSIGTVQVGTGDRRIVAICEIGAIDGVIAADEEMVYRLRLRSDDTEISNFRFPPSAVMPAPDDTAIVQGLVSPQWWPVDIPIEGNSTLEVLADHQIATATTHTVYIATAKA